MWLGVFKKKMELLGRLILWPKPFSYKERSHFNDLASKIELSPSAKYHPQTVDANRFENPKKVGDIMPTSLDFPMDDLTEIFSHNDEQKWRDGVPLPKGFGG